MSSAPFPQGSQVRIDGKQQATVVGAGAVGDDEVRLVVASPDAPVQAVKLDHLTPFAPLGVEVRYYPYIGVRVLDGRIVAAQVDWSSSLADEAAYDPDAGEDVLLPEGTSDLIDTDLLGFRGLAARTPADDAAALRRIADLIERTA